jgi:competence protein ComEC
MRLKIALPLLVLLILAFILATTTLSAPDHHIKVSFIDVGQGDAALIQNQDGYTILIDGGPTAAGADLVAYLRDHGTSHIDVIIISHAHLDHFGGLPAVLAAPDITVGEVYYNGYDATTQSWYALATAVAGEGITMGALQFPSEYSWGGTTGYVLGPAAGIVNPDHNEASVVLLLDHGGQRFLFAGDLGFSGEAEVIARGTPVAAGVLKVGHHGSKYSSSEAFLAAVSPAHAVISVGSNSYGHPAPEAIARLQAAGAQVWRTDLSGSIILYGDGETYSVLPEVTMYWVYVPVAVKAAAPTPTPTPIPIYPTPTPIPIYPTPTPLPEQPTPTHTHTPSVEGWTLVSLTSPITRGSMARLEIQTQAYAACYLEYYTPIGNKSTAQGLGDTTADGGGRCVWEWRISSNTTPGTGELRITADGRYGTLPIVIME